MPIARFVAARRACAALGVYSLVTLLLVTLMLFAMPSAVAAQEEVPTVDLQLSGSIETGPSSGGITTSDVLEYDLTITNLGSVPLPAGALSLKMFVENDSTRSNAEMEVSRFRGSGFRPLGTCGNARTREILCTNSGIIEPGKSISVVLRHRHPEPLAGKLRFYAELAPNNGGYVEPDGGLSNNGFRGQSYEFANPPVTTTTTAPATTTTSTTESTTSSTDPASTTTDPDASTTTTDVNGSSTTETTLDSSSTTEASSTSSTEATSTTEASTTTAPTTTTSTTVTTSSSTTSNSASLTTTITASASSTAPNVGSVEALRADVELIDADSALALGPGVDDDNDGGPPYLWIFGGIAVLALFGGIGLAGYTLYRPDPPLVDIRKWDQV